MEDSFTRFPNFILEKLMSFDLSGREFKVVLAVIRKTYGFHKASEELSLKTLSELTGVNRSYTSKIVKSLIERKVFVEIDSAEFASGRRIALNEDVDMWMENFATVAKNSTVTVVKNSTVTVAKNSTPTYIKENNKRNNKEINYRKGVYERKKTSYDLELFKAMLNRDD